MHLYFKCWTLLKEYMDKILKTLICTVYRPPLRYINYNLGSTYFCFAKTNIHSYTRHLFKKHHSDNALYCTNKINAKLWENTNYRYSTVLIAGLNNLTGSHDSFSINLTKLMYVLVSFLHSALWLFLTKWQQMYPQF